MDLKYVKATEDDIPELTKVMTRAFDDDSQKHLGKAKGGPPGYDNGDFFRKWLLPYKESIGYKILANDKVIGGFIVWVFEHGKNSLGTIFIDPDYQDQGIGTQAMQFIFDSYADSKRWTLGTPSWATKNHHFYEKNGFKKIREETVDDLDEGVSFIYQKIIE
ncbi:MAG: GNAT family N-acetyltransferase [Promethearchaeota archaeon]